MKPSPKAPAKAQGSELSPVRTDRKPTNYGAAAQKGSSEAEQALLPSSRAETSFWSRHGEHVGMATTFTAMIAQGALGMLLADKYIWKPAFGNSDEGYAARASFDFLTFAAALFGKYCIVHMYNNEDFKHLPKLLKTYAATLKAGTNIKNWNRWGFVKLLNFFATVNISFVFAGLVRISFDGTAKLLDEFGAPQEVGNLFRNLGFQFLFMASAFVCNLLGFPTIHTIGMNTILNARRSAFLSIDELKKEQDVAFNIERLRLYINHLHKNKKTQEISAIHTALPTLTTTLMFTLKPDTDPQSNYQRILNEVLQCYRTHEVAINQAAIPDNKTEILPTRGQSHVIRLLMLASAVVGVAGLSNFGQIAVSTLGAVIKDPVFNDISYGFAFASMALMALGTIPQFVGTYTTSAFGKQKDISVLPRCKSVGIMVGAVFILSGLGCTPNVFQSIYAQQPIWLITCAALSSFMLEWPGLEMVFLGGAKRNLSKKDPNAGNVITLDENLAALRDMPRSLTFSAA